MPAINDLPALEAAIQRYFDVLYECGLSKFDTIFHPACVLGTVKEGVDTVISLAEYREIIATRESPKSVDQPREESLQAFLALSDDAALVRVRIHDKKYQDHLKFIRTRGEWRIFSKFFVRE